MPITNKPPFFLINRAAGVGYVDIRIGRPNQPVSFSIDIDDRLHERDLGRISPATRFEIRFLYPVMDGRSSPIYSKPIKNRIVFERDNPPRYR